MKLFILLLLITGCGKPSKLVFNVKENGLMISEELKQSISYKEVYEKVFAPKCIGCHGQAAGVNLETYESAYSKLSAIKRSTVDRRSMPKAPVNPLTQKEVLLVAAWIEAGGPNDPLNGGNPGPTPDPNPEPGPVLTATYESIKREVIDRKCIACHTPGGTASRVAFTSKDELLDSPYDIVLPGNAEESGFMIVLRPDARKPMPPKSSGFSPVTDEEKAIIQEWIMKGAP